MSGFAIDTLMGRALELAGRGRGYVEPNPMVGAVIVDPQGRVVGEGWHARCGEAHAEVAALADCRARGESAAGATMVVTLEPCCHHGKTPPCTEALIEARVAKVVVAMLDPFEQVAGRGIQRLRDAGIVVEVGPGQEQARELNEPFIKRITTGLPWVIVKWAQTLDGKIATRTGDSQWISGEASRRRVHALRGRVDAVMVGIGTVLADDPRLNARDVEVRRIARRVVVDPRLRTTGQEKLFQGPGGVTVGHAQGADKGKGEPAQGVERVALATWRAGGLDLRPLLHHLAQVHQASNVLVEGGAGLTGSLLEQGLVDQVLAFVAPRLMGDVEALDPAAGSACTSIAEAMRLKLCAVERVGDDVLLDYRVRREGVPPRMSTDEHG